MFKYERPIITLFILGVLRKCELLACGTSHLGAAHTRKWHLCKNNLCSMGVKAAVIYLHL